LETLACKSIGNPMLYDIIELAREYLTACNFPSGIRCSICLFEFAPEDQFMTTECFHYLHSRCLSDYAHSTSSLPSNSISTNLQLICPVCRETIIIKQLKTPEEYSEPYFAQVEVNDGRDLIEEAKQEMRKFDDIYNKQQEQGGIIDEEAERNKFLVRISENVESNVSEERSRETEES